MSEFLSLVQDFKKHLIAEHGLKRALQGKTVPQPAAPRVTLKPKPPEKPEPIIAPKPKPPEKVEETKVTLTPFRSEAPSEVESMLEAIKKNCPSIQVTDVVPTFEESKAPVNFIYSTEEEKSFIEKVAKALEERSLSVILSEAPIEKARLTICSKSAAHFKGEITLEEIALYKQDTLLKRTLWENLKTHLGLHK